MAAKRTPPRRRTPQRTTDTMPPGGRAALSVPEAGAVLGCSASTVWRLLADGELPRVRIGRRVYVSRAAVDDFLARGGTTSTALRPTGRAANG